MMTPDFSRLTSGLLSSPPRRWQWMLLAIAILVLDYLTGPLFQFAILFVIPVILATWSDGRTWGFGAALALPLGRLALVAQWSSLDLLLLETLDQLLDAIILIGFVFVTHRFILQERKIRVLQGMLPICGFCKRIRTHDQDWHQLEEFITANSEARFSHTFCPECAERHYSGYV